MGLFNGIMGAVVNPMNLAQLAMGPAGWASLATRIMFSAIGQQAIQQMGQQMGLPQSMIDMAQAQFCATCGDTRGVGQNIRQATQELAGQFNLAPTQQGQLERTGNETASKLTDMMLDRVRASGDEESQAAASGSAGGKGGSLLMKIAIAMGQLLDKKMTEMAGLTDKIGGLGTIDNKNQSQLGELTGKLQGLGQEVNLLSNAMTNTIKSIGEANTTIARKG